MSPEQFLRETVSRLELTEGEIEKISIKHRSLREGLRAKLPVKDDFLTGSYARRTIIKPKREDKYDVDFFLVFETSTHLPSLVLELKRTLEDIGSNDDDVINVRSQNRSITIIYQDNFQIDVVPAFQNQNKRMYEIFDKRSQIIILSNPKIHGERLTEANDTTASGSVKRLIPIIKLLKFWKRAQCDYVKSFHLECLAVEVLKDDKIDSFSYGLSKFFAKAANHLIQGNLRDPANPQIVIDAYLDEDGKRGDLIKLILKQKQITDEAFQLERDGKNEEAVNIWRQIFCLEDDFHKNGELVQKRSVIINHPPHSPWCNV